MKKTVFIAFLLIANLAFSQVNRFVYQVTMKPDADDKADVKIENAYLDITPEKSLFYAENRIKRDSIIRQAMQNGGVRMGGNREQMESLRSIINYTVEKDSKEQKTYYLDRLGRDQYSYPEDRMMTWKILPETTKIGDYKVQKAETDFAGRKWTAWFTTDLPYQDGPYKFNGLPGLIVKVEDADGDYSFDLMKNYKVAALPEMMQFGNTIKVKRADYAKQQAKFKSDPMSFMTQGGGGSGAPAPPMSARGGQNPAEMRKRMEERVKEELKKNSNPIEKS
ncbi:hypothetical protein ASG01_05680 [Chryseobacterium sp. Leaf180]|uniref:GLPGLI family protein n=1 Tax=Chryseobacterium sp. Leaf180 TaxID=1736289 RepID=UPI0007022D2A|nr:GLPGLI family protein [Chryseobacterium sp. Leaf180]KQR95336.1 hypothetical protein ASG01_05680 [Chryseobacterium sp. Leaf180]